MVELVRDATSLLVTATCAAIESGKVVERLMLGSFAELDSLLLDAAVAAFLVVLCAPMPNGRTRVDPVPAALLLVLRLVLCVPIANDWNDWTGVHRPGAECSKEDTGKTVMVRFELRGTDIDADPDSAAVALNLADVAL